jgi:hypothetical protein
MIPFSHGERLFAAAAEPKTLHVMRGSHNDAFLLPGSRYIENVRSFVETLSISEPGKSYTEGGAP